MAPIEPVDWLFITLPVGVCRAMQIWMNDKITERVRGFGSRHFGSYFRYSIECPWCSSTQIGLVTVALLAWDRTRNPTAWILMALSASVFAVLADRIIDRTPMLEDKPVHGTLADHVAEDINRTRAEPPAEVRAALSKVE